MEESEGHLLAIVVGSYSDRFVQQTLNIFSDYEIETVHCENIYSAVSRLAANNHGNVLVVGRFGQLDKEQGRFFRMAGEKGLVCCCLADGNLTARDRRTSAAKENIIFVNEPMEIEERIIKLFSDDVVLRSEKKKNKEAPAFNRNDFLATKAELDALFGA